DNLVVAIAYMNFNALSLGLFMKNCNNNTNAITNANTDRAERVKTDAGTSAPLFERSLHDFQSFQFPPSLILKKEEIAPFVTQTGSASIRSTPSHQMAGSTQRQNKSSSLSENLRLSLVPLHIPVLLKPRSATFHPAYHRHCTVTKLNTENHKIPIFSLSFGNGADKGFLRKLSGKNQGFSRHIYEASDSSLQLQDFYKQISSPLLSNVNFKYESGVDNVTDTKFPIYFKGSELVVAGR
ncbi:hypothetical protein NQ317_007964, partial [Molorchus minor]